VERVRHAPVGCLGVEGGPLAYAEAVLLVHHHERELAEGHGRLEQRVGAHEQGELSRAEAAEDLPPPGGGGRPREQGHRSVAPEEAVEGGQMLLGEGLGGSQERGLGPVLDGAEHGVEGHHGLA